MVEKLSIRGHNKRVSDEMTIPSLARTSGIFLTIIQHHYALFHGRYCRTDYLGLNCHEAVQLLVHQGNGQTQEGEKID